MILVGEQHQTQLSLPRTASSSQTCLAGISPVEVLVRWEKHRRVCSGDFPARATFEGNEKAKGSNVVRCGKLHHKPLHTFSPDIPIYHVISI